MNTKFDLHLSAYQIAPITIRTVESLGFARDEFANNRRCDRTAYHGTYRGSRALPDDDLWSDISSILKADSSFVGGVEEEEFTPNETFFFDTSTSATVDTTVPIAITRPQPGSYKACDIHININLDRASPIGVQSLEKLQIASFDKPGNDCVRRVYSATCETVESGKALFNGFKQLLSRIHGINGKMKFERTTRFLRLPKDAPVLPLTLEGHVRAWLRAMRY